MLAIRIKCDVCGKEKAVNDWRDYFQFDGHKFCSYSCARKYQQKRTQRDINYYKNSMDQAGKFMHEEQSQLNRHHYAINDLPF